jgi:hypothetical protein
VGKEGFLTMVSNLDEKNLHHLITVDFNDVWDSVAANPVDPIGRGNFMFARQAMTLLEFASRLCHKNANALSDFSNALYRIESKYFTRMPSVCANSDTEFTLPFIRNPTGDFLLWALFDLTRHGLAHQYQDIIANLTDGKKFFMILLGAKHLKTIQHIQNTRTAHHLAYCIDSDGDVGLKVDPAVLFLDFRSAIANSNLLNRGLTFNHLIRPRQPRQSKQSKTPTIPSSQLYNFNSDALKSSLKNGGHTEVKC